MSTIQQCSTQIQFHERTHDDIIHVFLMAQRGLAQGLFIGPYGQVENARSSQPSHDHMTLSLHQCEDEQRCRCADVNVDVKMSRAIGENVDVM